LYQVGDLFELNVKLQCQKVKVWGDKKSRVYLSSTKQNLQFAEKLRSYALQPHVIKHGVIKETVPNNIKTKPHRQK